MFVIELGATSIFFDLNQPVLPDKAILKIVDIRSGASFEYLATKIGIWRCGGFYTATSAQLFDHNDKSNDYFFRKSNGSSPYISFCFIIFCHFLKAENDKAGKAKVTLVVFVN